MLAPCARSGCHAVDMAPFTPFRVTRRDNRASRRQIPDDPTKVAPLTTAETLLRDALRDRYALVRELGRGGMATVWLADDLRHDRQVALKLLHPELASSLGADRFLREIRIAARLQHPHILTVLDSGAAAGPTVGRSCSGTPCRTSRARRCGPPGPRGPAPARRRAPDRPRRRGGTGPCPRSTASSTATSSPRTSCSARRSRAGGGLRHRSGVSGSRRRVAAHRDRHRARDAALHEPRAGGRRARARPPHRRVLPRLRALRDARG